MEDRLAGALADVHDDPVVLESRDPGGLRDKLEHPFRLVRWELRDLPEAGNVPLRHDEEMRIRLWVDVANGDEALRGVYVLALANELTEEAILRQR